MTAFENGLSVEKAGDAMARRFLEQEGFTKLVPLCPPEGATNSNRAWLYEIQLYGDLLGCQYSSKKTVEVKTEERTTGNLFLETWSCKRDERPGWVKTSLSDFLLYQFLDTKMQHLLRTDRMRDWYEAHGMTLRETLQTKHAQENDTWGVCVSVERLQRDVVIIKSREDGKLVHHYWPKRE